MALQMIPDFLKHALLSTFTAEPRPGLKPIPGTRPLTIEAVLCPVLLYYIALLVLPPPPPPTIASIQVGILRNVLALLAAFLFLRLPLAYHVPQSIGLTYQLGLVGLYGGLRVLDAFFISYYGFHHVPRRVRYTHTLRPDTSSKGLAPRHLNGDSNHVPKISSAQLGPLEQHVHAKNNSNELPAVPQAEKPSLQRGLSLSDMLDNMTNETYTSLLDRDASYTQLMQRLVNGPTPIPVIETAHTEDGWPHGFADRAAWALELELSMRGVGFTWTTADVRHTKKTWLPTVQNRVHSILFRVGPVLLVSWVVIKTTYVTRILPMTERVIPSVSPFDELSYPEQYALTAALGAFLMAAFSFGHSAFAIVCSPLAPSPLAFFPPLYTTRVWDVMSARGFWSFGWHRLFARLFLVWGVWPGEYIERKLTGKSPHEPADVGKVLGGFFSSALVHSFAVRGTLGGNWGDAAGEAKFFVLNGIGVLVEEGVKRIVKRRRKAYGLGEKKWYDEWLGRVWWIGLLLTTGRNFARGWTKAGLVREMAFM